MRRALVLLIVLASAGFLSASSASCEVIDVSIKGMDDGVRSSRQQDYTEAVTNAMLEAIQRAGVEIESLTRVVDLYVRFQMVEQRAKGVLLPGFQVIDIGYTADGTYQVVLIGRVQVGEKKVATGRVAIVFELEGGYYAQWASGGVEINHPWWCFRDGGMALRLIRVNGRSIEDLPHRILRHKWRAKYSGEGVAKTVESVLFFVITLPEGSHQIEFPWELNDQRQLVRRSDDVSEFLRREASPQTTQTLVRTARQRRARVAAGADVVVFALCSAADFVLGELSEKVEAALKRGDWPD